MKSLRRVLLFIGAVAVAEIIGTSSISASKYTVISEIVNNSPESRNVTLTGDKPLLNSLTGKKYILTTDKAEKLRDTPYGFANFRVYKAVKNGKGQFFYKVVSFNKEYRGWIYGGTQLGKYSGGIESYQTLSPAEISDDIVPNETVLRPLNGTSSDIQLYKQPAYSEYKVGLLTDSTGAIIGNTTFFKNLTFTVDKAVKTTREGEIWYRVSNASTPDVNGAYIKKAAVLPSYWK